MQKAQPLVGIVPLYYTLLMKERPVCKIIV